MIVERPLALTNNVEAFDIPGQRARWWRMVKAGAVLQRVTRAPVDFDAGEA